MKGGKITTDPVPGCTRTFHEDFPDKPSLKPIQDSHYGRIPMEQNKVLQEIAKAHIESFDWAMTDGLPLAIKQIEPLEFMVGKSRVRVQISSAEVSCPQVARTAVNCRSLKVFPRECRLRRITYRGRIEVVFDWWLNGLRQESIKKGCGDVPIMVKSIKCNLKDLSPKRVVEAGEELEEFGGYFVVNGNEKVIVHMIILHYIKPHPPSSHISFFVNTNSVFGILLPH